MVVISIINIMVWTSVVTLLLILQINEIYANACGLYHPYSNKLQLKNLLYITHVNGSTEEGSLAKLDCKKGYYVNGPKNPYAKCVSDKWDIDDKYLGCVRINCDNPHQLEIQHGKINTFNISDRFSESYLQDSIYWVTCDIGFKPKGYPVRRCLWNGTHGVWSQPADKYGEKLLEGADSPPVCEEDPKYINYSCLDPHKLTIKIGKINTFSISDRSSEDYLQDSIYWITCDIGFKPKGYPVRRCMWNGTHGVWSQPADIYGKKLLVDGDSPPVCEVDPITISIGFFIVICLIGFIGTGCAVCVVKLCEVCKRKLKQKQDDGQGENQSLNPENDELAAQTKPKLIEQIRQLRTQLSTQHQQNNQEIADVLTKINEQITRTDELSRKIEPLVPPDETQQDVIENNQNTADDAQGTPRQTLLTQIDKLKVKHDLLSSQIDLLIVRFEEQIRQPSREGEIEELKGKIEELSNEKDTLKNNNEQLKDQNMRLEEEKKRSEEKYGKLKDNVQLKEEYEKKLQQKDSEYQELERKYTVANINHEHNAAKNELENTLAREREHIQRLSKLIEDMKKENNTDMTMIKDQINSVVADLEKTVSHAKDAGLNIVHTLADARKTLEDLVVLRIEPRIDPDTSQSNEPGELGVAGRR